ncbi:MAG: hypothetical protein KF799_12715 [Bdellovibrionales bacterium]|nr:hypothetical protein [Bdellovibrionales bacterium]
MSSVGSSDGSNRKSDNETIRRKYEDFRQNESELVKKHQKEIRRLNEAHYSEVERMKEEHQKQMASMQLGSQDAISRRDHKYNKEMEEVREMARKQAQTTAEENQRREDLLRKTSDGDRNTERANNDARFNQLTKDYSNNLTKQDKLFQDGLKEGREAQQAAIRANHDKLTKAHEAETRVLREDRDNSVRNLQKQFDDYRTSTTQEKRDHMIRDLQEKERSSDTLMQAVRSERNARTDSEAVLRDGFQDGLEQMRERYGKALRKDAAAHKMSTDDLKSGVVNRVDNQVRRLENEVVALKENNTRNELRLKNQMKREIANYRDAAQKNVENLQDQRDETIRMSNEMNQKDVHKVRDDLENQMIESNRFYRGRMEEQNRINRTAYDRLKLDMEARNTATKDLTDNRIKHIVDVTEQEKGRLIELSQENHTASQRMKADQMKTLRAELEDDKQKAVNSLQDMMRKQELQHAERMNLVVSKYEKQLQGLKDQLIRERKLGDENVKRLTEEMSRLHKMEVDQVESKNREKVRQLSSQHSNEIRTVNKRHEERLDQVIGELKKT